jgi:phospholipid/cholesterol/gamma-HCH transport system permease protein
VPSVTSEPPVSLFPQKRTPSNQSLLVRLGSFLVTRWQFAGRMFTTLRRAVAAPFQPGKSAGEVSSRVAIRQVFFTGVEALPLISVIALLIGGTFVIQAQLVGALPGEILGKVLVAVILRELAPLTTAIVVAGRSGTAIATELGNMKAQNEILGLASLGIDPYRFVVFPRLIGSIVSVVVLTVYFGALAIIGGLAASHLVAGVSFGALQSGFVDALLPGDLPLFALKSSGMGLIVGWLCCHYGFEVNALPTEVPQKASQAVVVSMLACIVFNSIVTWVFYSLVGPPVSGV